MKEEHSKSLSVLSIIIMLIVLGLSLFSRSPTNPAEDKETALKADNISLQAKVTDLQQQLDAIPQAECDTLAKAFYKKNLTFPDGPVKGVYTSHWDKESQKCYAELKGDKAYTSDGKRLNSFKYIYNVTDEKAQAEFSTMISSGVEKVSNCRIKWSTRYVEDVWMDCKDGNLFQEYEFSVMGK